MWFRQQSITHHHARTLFDFDELFDEPESNGGSTMLKPVVRGFSLCLLMAAMSGVSRAQSMVLDLPLPSQPAEISQTIGITNITIKYHRPLAADRKIWDGLVPYGKVWRAGANENTTITFSDPVTVEGKPLDKGTYGLHMIPNANEWTIIFSKAATAWGSFTYDQSEDALRVTAKPAAADMHNALTYDFEQLQPDSAVVVLEWEKIAVPFKVAVNVHEVVEASLKRQFRGLSQYTWISWDDAANYLLTEKTDLDAALTYTNKSVEIEDRYDNEMTKSKVLVALNRRDDAAVAQKKALDLASPLQVHLYARQLQAENHNQEAFAIFLENAKKHPDPWFVHAGLARVYSSQGKFDDAVKEMKLAISVAPDNQKTYLDGLVTQLQAKRDINKT
jgi:tetratricopeptide (TPR) repeat protein